VCASQLLVMQEFSKRIEEAHPTICNEPSVCPASALSSQLPVKKKQEPTATTANDEERREPTTSKKAAGAQPEHSIDFF